MILVGGENLIDFIQEKSPSGDMAFRPMPGGSPYNVAKALALQQVDTGYLTPISDDSLGDLLAESLPAQHLTLLSKRNRLPSSLAVISLANGQPEYRFYRENTAERDVTLASLQAAIPKAARGFYIGSLAITDGPDADAWEASWIACHKAGVFTAIDPNIRPAFIKNRTPYLERLNRMLAEADLVKLSDEDIAWIAPDTPMLDAAKQMFARSNAALLVLTMGSKGAIGISKNTQVDIPAAPVTQLKDTVGAGDTFMATLIAQISSRSLMKNSILQDIDRPTLQDILTTAAKAAAINCSRVGCSPPVLSEL